MARKVLVADDRGSCFSEVRSLVPPGTETLKSSNMDDCIAKMRDLGVNVLVISAIMPQAFSLIRIVKKSADLAGIPLIVVAESGQENLIEKHGQLPTRADRYLMRPIDPELFADVLREFLDEERDISPRLEEATVPGRQVPSAQDFLGDAPAAMQRIQDELRRSRENIQALEKDLHISMQSTKQMAALREENRLLRQRLRSFDEQSRAAREHTSIFERLETGYKDTIADLERLIREKDNLIADIREQLPSADQGSEVELLMEKLEATGTKMSRTYEKVRKASSLLEFFSSRFEEIDLDQIGELLETLDPGDSISFSEDESTQIVDIANINEKNL